MSLADSLRYLKHDTNYSSKAFDKREKSLSLLQITNAKHTDVRGNSSKQSSSGLFKSGIIVPD